MIISKSNEPMGFIDLFDYDEHNNRAGVSIVLVDTYRQKGYGKDALNLLVKYSFDKLFIHQLYCNVLEDNFASICLFESVGFTKVGIKKEWRYYKGVFKNEYLFSVSYIIFFSSKSGTYFEIISSIFIGSEAIKQDFIFNNLTLRFLILKKL